MLLQIRNAERRQSASRSPANQARLSIDQFRSGFSERASVPPEILRASGRTHRGPITHRIVISQRKEEIPIPRGPARGNEGALPARTR